MIPTLDPWVLPSVPKYTLAEARQAAQNLLDEVPSEARGWEEVAGATNYEGIASCHSRQYAVNENYDEIYCSKAESQEVQCTLNQVRDVFWDLDCELKVWNNSSLKAASILSSNSSNTEQLVYQERKVHASISMGGDVVFSRAYEFLENKSFFSWATSVDAPQKPPLKNIRRCFLLVSGFYARATSPTTCVISACASYYETGNVPAVAITEECKRVALRICRIVKRIGDVVRISGLAPLTAPGSGFTPANSVSQPRAQVTSGGGASAGKQCPSCNISVNGNFCHTCGSKTVEAGNGCGRCGAPRTGGKFCATCGNIL